MSATRMEIFRMIRERSWDKEDWFAPLAVALKGLTAEQASWQPPGGDGNTIWQTVNHINYYNQRILNGLNKQRDAKDAPSNEATFGEPGSGDEAAWNVTLEETRRIAEGLRTALAEMDDDKLDVPGRSGGTWARSLAEWIGHDAYHTGQIVLIRKQQGSWK